MFFWVYGRFFANNSPSMAPITMIAKIIPTDRGTKYMSAIDLGRVVGVAVVPTTCVTPTAVSE